MSKLKTNVLGYPRIGAKRELKVAVEKFWKGRISEEELERTAANLRKKHWLRQEVGGVDLIPSNDFSYYDQVLDMSCLLGNLPRRFGQTEGKVDLEMLFKVARGSDTQPAAEMTKWFDTNYHYLVPEFDAETEFRISSEKVFAEFEEAKSLGILTKPVLLGPISYLALGKGSDDGFESLQLLDQLVDVYGEILGRLSGLGAEWVQLDEPVLSLNLEPDQRGGFVRAYKRLVQAAPELKLLVASYFGPLRENLETLFELPVAAYHVDVVNGRSEIDRVIATVPTEKVLSLGVVNGRNIWKNDYQKSLVVIEKAREVLGDEQILISSSCSLLHSPYSLRYEEKLDEELKGWMSFAEEKVDELDFLRNFLIEKASVSELEENVKAIKAYRESERIHRAVVQEKLVQISPRDLERESSFDGRQAQQRRKLKLPGFPTTTIGSFPQTKELRSARARWRKGELGQEEYERFLKTSIKECVEFQEELGLDLLVHGEAERTDMVEFFGEKLDGFAFTQNGWVQSYGSRCVKPPVIYGDVYRPEAMTVHEAVFAQSLTKRPMKGMLTGPITILQWSFVREDQARSVTARQIALAIREEVCDLESAGLPAIQIDEPALREGLPLRKEDHRAYLRWAVDAFRLAASGVDDATQIHTHMCYCEFNDIIDSIAELDADVITIETSRSNMELLEAFSDFQYPNEIGPGVYDIHSPRIPEREEIIRLLKKAAKVIPAENLWVNPDCGLKTRSWEEVRPALERMVSAAVELRSRELALC